MVTKSFPPRRVTLSTLRSERGGGTRIPKNRTSCLQVSRCRVCDSVYNLYSGTVFAQKQYRPAQVVLLLQGFSSSQLARELGISRQTVLTIRQVLQGSAQMLQPEGPLPDTETETDEMFQNAGEKGGTASRPKGSTASAWGNKHKGHGTYENNRLPIVGTLGRESGLVRLRVEHRTDGATLSAHVHSSRVLLLPSTQMDGAAIIVLTAPMLFFPIVMVNGREMAMQMVFAKSTSIRLKASGQRCATFYAHFAMFIKSSFRDILLSVNLLLISKLLLLILYQNLFNALNLNMSQWQPTTKSCHHCGHRNLDIQLKDRYWTCQACHIHHDRDINAAINILQAGKERVWLFSPA